MLRECLERQNIPVNNFQIDSFFEHSNDFSKKVKVLKLFCSDFFG